MLNLSEWKGPAFILSCYNVWKDLRLTCIGISVGVLAKNPAGDTYCTLRSSASSPAGRGRPPCWGPDLLPAYQGPCEALLLGMNWDWHDNVERDPVRYLRSEITGLHSLSAVLTHQWFPLLPCVWTHHEGVWHHWGIWGLSCREQLAGPDRGSVGGRRARCSRGRRCI